MITDVHDRTIRSRMRLVSTALTLAVGSAGAACSAYPPANHASTSALIASSRLADGKVWTTHNLNVTIDGSYCYGDVALNCDRYGRLYTWAAAQRGCQSLGDGWRLPTNEEFQQLAKHYGGVRDDSDDGGKAAYAALMTGGRSGFNALVGGGRAPDAVEYARLEAHGFYWTASESGAASAWLYNFGKGGQILNRHRDAEKQRAVSVRCVRE